MNRIRIKICGITNETDALNAVYLGVDALGFNFYENSKRYIKPSLANSIIKKLPPFVTSVGLFVNQSKEYIREILSNVRIDILQFHGDESKEFCNSFSMPYIKSIRINEGMTIIDIKKFFKNYSDAKAILFDSYKDGIYGGTGTSFNWSILYGEELEFYWILSGGLNSSNIEEALFLTGAKIVDVSSGVEYNNFCKDLEKMRSFVDKVNSFKVFNKFR